MKLMTKELRRQLPPLNSTENQPLLEIVAYTCYFTADSYWYWYATEFDGDDLFFGLVAGHFLELGYFRLSELKTVRGQLGLPIERNKWWKPTTLREIVQKHKDRPGAELF